MTTRGVVSILFTLTLACFAGLPAVSAAQELELALVMVFYTCGPGACDEGTPTTTLVYPGTPGTTNNARDRAPAWSPDGARIAFERAGEILVMDVADGGLVNLTNHAASDESPAWSPDGSQIAFASDRDGQAELYLMNADGSGVVRLTNLVGFTGQPAWSPDGAKIAFNCMIDTGNSDICTVNRDGSGFVRLTTDPAADSGPAWSPDGRIVFATARYSADPTGYFGIELQLAVMNQDGSGVSQMGMGTAGFDPSWSQDGTRIAFVRMEPCYFMVCPNVYVINADGTAESWVAEGFDPAWRPALNLPATAVVLSPGSLAFGSQVVGSTSQLQTVTLINTGTADLAISSLAVSGDFAQTNTCGSTMAAGASCTISIMFTATAAGPRTGAVTIVDNAAGSPHVVALSGTGNAPPVASFTTACSGVTCSFNASGSADPDGTITSYGWSLGDGTSVSGPTVSHTYATAGTYPITLTVMDNVGATDAQSKSLTVIQPSMHVGDLDRAVTNQGSTWTAIATITVHDKNHSPVANATVSGSWSSGATGSCTTNAGGQCAAPRSTIPKSTGSVIFTVANVTHATITYNSSDNHDPDGESNGTTITVHRP
jgi:PKD domain/WD40-like Beta Propeller Repeat/Abnormal spindle-like microcephaly-assoc'd, ASPM-SPD-2-Hydin